MGIAWRYCTCSRGVLDQEPCDFSRGRFRLNIAKHLHPEEFKDLDMKKEVKEYFKEFYRYDLTDEEAELYLEHKDPNNI